MYKIGSMIWYHMYYLSWFFTGTATQFCTSQSKFGAFTCETAMSWFTCTFDQFFTCFGCFWLCDPCWIPHSFCHSTTPVFWIWNKRLAFITSGPYSSLKTGSLYMLEQGVFCWWNVFKSPAFLQNSSLLASFTLCSAQCLSYNKTVKRSSILNVSESISIFPNGLWYIPTKASVTIG